MYFLAEQNGEFGVFAHGIPSQISLVGYHHLVHKHFGNFLEAGVCNGVGSTFFELAGD